MEEIPLYEEYRLIEKSESEINGAWRGAHLLLFFLAFVFGSFCTFCFHMLMYLFEEKCVLFPQLLTPSEVRHNYIEYTPDNDQNQLPLDYVTTKWKEKSTCYLPTYVPLLSGVCGLVWTAMFLMCSSGSQTLTGLQRSWRILPPIFIFSLAMGGLCIYSSAITQAGLLDLCSKLSEVTGGGTGCSFHINVATLVFEKRIRGVYQAIRLTIISAWLHTTCWLMAAALALLRVVLVVDFSLVLIKADFRGNLEKLMELHETQVRTISPDVAMYNDDEDKLLETQFSSNQFPFSQSGNTLSDANDFYYISKLHPAESTVTLQTVDIESPSTSALNITESDSRIAAITGDLAKRLQVKVSQELAETESMRDMLSETFLTRERANTEHTDSSVKVVVTTRDDTSHVSGESAGSSSRPSTSKKLFEPIPWPDEDDKNNSSDSISITSHWKTSNIPLTTTGSFSQFPPPKKRYKSRKSNLKNTGVQTDPVKTYTAGKTSPKVHIADSPVKIFSETASRVTLVPIEYNIETHQETESHTLKTDTLTPEGEIKEDKAKEEEIKQSDTKEQHEEEEKETVPPKTKEQPKPKEKQD